MSKKRTGIATRYFLRHYVFILVVLGFLIVRLSLSWIGFHIDILSNAGWGQWIYDHGPFGFYQNQVWTYAWPTQPPFVSLVYGFDRYLYNQLLELFRYTSSYIVPHLAPGHMRWWFAFVIWFDQAKYQETTFSIGYLMTIKLLPILADGAIAWLIYSIAITSKAKRPLLWPCMYLLSPFSWYLSVFWGQYDQVGFAFLLGAVVLLQAKKPLLVPLLLATSICLKPTTLIFVPLMFYLYIRQKPRPLIVIFGFVTILAIYVITTAPFTDQNLIRFTEKTLYPLIFEKSELRVSTNAFNFWHIIIGNKAFNDMWPVLFVPAKIWGVGIFAFLHILVFKKLKFNQPAGIWTACFIIGFGGWLFLTNMLERYAFAGLVFGLITCLYQPKLLKYWLILSVVFTLNLYHGWWFPNQLEVVKTALQWQEGLLTRILAIILVGAFIVFVKQINNQAKKDTITYSI